MKQGTTRHSLAALFVFGLLAAVLVAAPASAQDSADEPSQEIVIPVGDGDGAGTGALVTGGGDNAPNIECVWLLPDNDGDKSLYGPDYWGNGMQYGDDDDPYTDAWDYAGECYETRDNPPKGDQDGYEGEGDAVRPLIQVVPNPHDYAGGEQGQNGEQFIEIWGAVDQAIGDDHIVVADVYHPDGTRKVNLPMTVTPRIPNEAGTSSYICPTPDNMFRAANATGQATVGAIDAMVWECENQTKHFWYGAFGLSKHQPHGIYTVEVRAVNTETSAVTLHVVHFEVLPTVILEKDFDSVYWNIESNDHVVNEYGGDLIWSPGAGGAQTVRNVGNAGMAIDLLFDMMCLDGNPLNCVDDIKRIDRFDAALGKEGHGLQRIGDVNLGQEPIPAGVEATFDESLPNVILCPNEHAKIEFSLYTGLQHPGKYYGVDEYGDPGGIHLYAHPSFLYDGNYLCPTDTGNVDYHDYWYPVGTLTPKANGYHGFEAPSE